MYTKVVENPHLQLNLGIDNLLGLDLFVAAEVGGRHLEAALEASLAADLILLRVGHPLFD